MEVVVAIEVPPPQERLIGAFVLASTCITPERQQNFSKHRVGAQHAAPQFGTMSNPTGFWSAAAATAFTPTTSPRRAKSVSPVYPEYSRCRRWCAQHFLRWPLFHDTPRVHHRDAVS